MLLPRGSKFRYEYDDCLWVKRRVSLSSGLHVTTTESLISGSPQNWHRTPSTRLGKSRKVVLSTATVWMTAVWIFQIGFRWKFHLFWFVWDTTSPQPENDDFTEKVVSFVVDESRIWSFPRTNHLETITPIWLLLLVAYSVKLSKSYA